MRVATRGPDAPTPPPHLFVYGSLRDGDIFALVTGRPQSAFRPVAARLPGAEIVHVRGETYPALRAGHGAAEGLALTGLDGESWSRLLFFEDTDYDLRAVEVLALPALNRLSCKTFWPVPALETGPPWDFARWQRQDKAIALKATEYYMALYQDAEATDLDAAWQAIKSRLEDKQP